MEAASTPHAQGLPRFGVALVALAFLAILWALAGPVIHEKLDERRLEESPALIPHAGLADGIVAR